MPQNVLVVESLAKSYDREIFSGLSFSIGEGESLGIIGGNGKGKTTLLNIIAGLEKPTSGVVSNLAATGYVMQQGGFIERLSLLDNLRFFCSLHGLKRDEAAERIAFCVDACNLSEQLKKRADKCSYGWKKRLCVAIALIPSPQLLLLDEATSGLDAKSRALLETTLRQLQKGGCSLIVVSHDKAEISGFCDRIIEL
jgi:ABC-2 type transport system ATP-binding protein